jgi:hypothetical protein
MAGAGAPDLDQDLPRPGLGHFDLAQFRWLLPLDQLVRQHDLSSASNLDTACCDKFTELTSVRHLDTKGS